MSKPVLYLCDHNYKCANSLFCELNGGECKHTVQKEHSRNKIIFEPSHDIDKDDRFEKVPTSEDFEGFLPFWVQFAYVEKEEWKMFLDIFDKFREKGCSEKEIAGKMLFLKSVRRIRNLYNES